jgi:hypothetical protein
LSSASGGGYVVLPDPAFLRIRNATLRIYLAIVVLMLVGILGLVAYAIRVSLVDGLTQPGPENSFGFALALLFLMAALLFHVVDKTYRVWPLGRRVPPEPPTWITDRSVLTLLRILVIVAAIGVLAFVLGGLLAT